MSFIIKAGYNIVRKDIINVTLKNTPYWNKGTIYVPNGIRHELRENEFNEVELARYNAGYAILVNNNVIYDSAFPLDYKITLMATPEYNKKVNMYNFIDYDCIPYKYIRTFYPPYLNKI